MKQKIGILCAMIEEVADILKSAHITRTIEIGCRTYHEGTINQQDVVIVFSRWGKVGAATTTTMLIDHFHVSEIIFVGTAGALSPKLNIGDVVIGNKFLQHDFNCTPILTPCELPFIKKTFLDADNSRIQKATQAVETFLNPNNFNKLFTKQHREEFNLINPKLLIGAIASGDTFFSSKTQKDTLLNKFPDLLCVEMEGAAVAQVCYEYETPLTVIRVISDAANDTATFDFNRFITETAARYSQQIIHHLIK